MQVNIFLIRHGETYGNINDIVLGNSDTNLTSLNVYNQPDPYSDLTETGIKQAKNVGEILNSYFDKNNIFLDGIFSSPRSRAISTAKFIVEKMGYNPIIKDRKNNNIFLKKSEIFIKIENNLHELDAGIFEGLPRKREFIENYNNSNYRCPNSKETLGESGERLKKCLMLLSEEISKANTDCKKNEINIIVVSHSFVIRQLLINEKYWDQREIKNGEVVILKYDTDIKKLSIMGRFE